MLPVDRRLCNLAWILAFSAGTARAQVPPPTVGPHAEEAARHAGVPDAPWTRLQAPERPLAPAAAATTPQLARRVYGYVPYWVTLDLATFRWDLVSDIVVFSADLRPDGTISSWHGWPQTALIQKAHDAGVKVHLCATLFNSSAEPSRIATFLGSAAAKTAATNALVAAVKNAGGDGLNIDFEFVPGASRDAFSAWIESLGAALRAAVPGAELTLAVPGLTSYSGYDGARLARAADRLLLMTYDFHYSGSSRTGPNSPLTKGGFWGIAVEPAVDAWLGLAPGAKLAMGVPYWGFDWPATSDQPNATTTAKASTVLIKNVYAKAAQYGRLWDAPSQTPWYRYKDAAGAWRQGWYDDHESLVLKYRSAKARDLAGVMIWALGYDAGRSEMWDALRGELGTPPAPGEPQLAIQALTLTPAELPEGGGLVAVSLRVKNAGAAPIGDTAPPPGTTYDESQESTGAVAGSFRVALELGDRPAEQAAYPFRWGLGRQLAPGEETTVEGYVRLRRSGARELWAAVVREGTGVVQDGVGRTTVRVAGTVPDGGVGDPDPRPEAPEPTISAGRGCASATGLGWLAAAALAGAALRSRRRR